jgi:hypothetical protein
MFYINLAVSSSVLIIFLKESYKTLVFYIVQKDSVFHTSIRLLARVCFA